MRPVGRLTGEAYTAWRGGTGDAMSRYAAGLSATLQGATVPYGYTLTVWCSGHVLAEFRGSPHLVRIALFVAGAAVAFALLRWTARESRAQVTPGTGSERPHLIFAVALQIGAIGAALAAVALVAQVPSGAVWPAGGFLATAIYMTGTAAGLTLRAG
jgi:hypothetical protein